MGTATRTVTIHGKPYTLEGPEIKAGQKAPDFTLIVDRFQRNYAISEQGESTLAQRGAFTGYRRLRPADTMVRRRSRGVPPGGDLYHQYGPAFCPGPLLRG